MLEFIVNYWYVFAIAAGVLLLGLFGYIIDRKKYDQYRQEIMHENGIDNTVNNNANISEVVQPAPVEQTPEENK